MLRPSFRKYFKDDNLDPSNTMDDFDPELYVDANPTWDSTENDDNSGLKQEGISEGSKAAKKEPGEGDPSWDSDRSIYELQLNQLQEQLVETMVENQQLGEELRQLKEKGKVEALTKELEEEQKKNKRLEEKLKKFRPKRPPEPSVKDKKGTPERRANIETAHDAWEDLSVVADNTVYPENVLLASGIASVNSLAFAGTIPGKRNSAVLESSVAPKENIEKIPTVESISRLTTIKIKVWNFVHDRISDFLDDEVGDTEVEEEDDALAVKTLRENVSRFSDGILPIRRFVTAFRNMLHWKNIWFSLSAFAIYLYSIWIGCFIPLMLLIAIIKLSINFLYAKGIAQKFGYSEKAKDTGEDKTEVSSWSERYQLVLQIARKVQNTLGNLADNLEKFESLFTWRHDEASRKLYTGLWIAFLATLILPTRYFYLPFGFGIGIKFFMIGPIYKRFPKVKKRYDNIDRLWSELPTREEDPVHKLKTEDVEPAVESNGSHSPTIDSDGDPISRPGSKEAGHSRNESMDSNSGGLTWSSVIFCDRFHLPQTEIQLVGWEDGRRCTLLNKDSPLSNMKHGRLYLTRNYLCFERNQFHSKKNFALRLHDIVEVHKSKPFSFLPGGGMSIEVTTKTNEKPFLFGAMMGRDEAYESILRAARSLNLSWGRKS